MPDGRVHQHGRRRHVDLLGQTLRYRHVSSIAINRTGTNLHAGTNHGVFEYQIA
jgi:hypothetical protein